MAGGGRTYNWKDSRKRLGLTCGTDVRARLRKVGDSTTTSTAAAAECAMRQIRQIALFGDAWRD
jgi:hypothetical protein